MENLLPIILEHVGQPDTLSAISSDWEYILYQNRMNLIEGLKRKYPGMNSMYSIWRYAILCNDIDTIRTTLSTLLFNDKDLFWWSQMYTLSSSIQMSDMIRGFLTDRVPLGLLHIHRSSYHEEASTIMVLSCANIYNIDMLLDKLKARNIDIKSEISTWISQSSLREFANCSVSVILYLYYHGYLPDEYSVMLRYVIRDIPYRPSTTLVRHYNMLILRLDAYESWCRISDEIREQLMQKEYIYNYSIGRILEYVVMKGSIQSASIYRHNPYLMLSLYRQGDSYMKSELFTYAMSLLERHGYMSPYTSILSIHVPEGGYEKYILSRDPSLFQNTILQQYLHIHNVRVDWYTHLLYTGLKPQDIPPTLWREVIHELLTYNTNRRMSDNKGIERIILLNRKSINDTLMNDIYSMCKDGDLILRLNKLYNQLK
jgi:hypothetical protein